MRRLEEKEMLCEELQHRVIPQNQEEGEREADGGGKEVRGGKEAVDGGQGESGQVGRNKIF